MLKKLDAFISHAWRNHEPWLEIVAEFDAIVGLTWRNFSVPWHDPALHASRPKEYELIRQTFETQIIPVDVILVLFDLYKQKSNVRWLNLCVEIANNYNKPICGVYSSALEHYDFEEDFLAGFECLYEREQLVCEQIVAKYATDAEFEYI